MPKFSANLSMLFTEVPTASSLKVTGIPRAPHPWLASMPTPPKADTRAERIALETR